MPSPLKDLFLLDPDVIFLNHGSFGACPRPVFDEYQRWQRELERQPVDFLGRRSHALMAEARQALADYVHADPDEVVYFPNPTTAVNMVARSLELGPGDEVLATDHEYGACERTWRFLSQKRGFSYLRQPIPLPVTTPADFVERFWAGVTPRTRLIFISHLTSATALIFPLAEICRRARAAGILTLIDGAHAPGQLPVDLHAVDPDFYTGACHNWHGTLSENVADPIGPDFYVGACHKWLCAPKGSAFLFARREVQPPLEPLVVSWGWDGDVPSSTRFVDHHEWQGTRDMSAFLATPAAIRFQAENNWEQVRCDSHELVRQARDRINALIGLEPVCPDSSEWFVQMATIRLPSKYANPEALTAFKGRLYEEYRIEIPVILWNDQPLLRISVQGYNTQDDVDALISALGKVL